VEELATQKSQVMKSRCDLGCHIVRHLGLLICGEEVASLDIGKREQSHIASFRHTKSRHAWRWTPGFDWRSYGRRIRDDLGAVSPFQSFEN
jgi:hypothetical protein